MEKDLRLVKFLSDRPQGFIPDSDQNTTNGMDVSQREQEGYFHCWVNEERKSEQSGLFREETVALVEEVLTGKMYHVDYDLLRFVQK